MPERLRNPWVITGVVLMIVGVICALASKTIAEAAVKEVPDQEPCRAEKEILRDKKVWKIRIASTAIGAVVAIAGALTAIFAG